MTKTLGIIGCGNMAEAIVAAACANRVLSSEHLIVFDRDLDKAHRFVARFGGTVAPDARALSAASDRVLFAVKPQDVPTVLADVAPVFFANRIVALSIAAGIPIATFADYLGDETPIVRLMPNTPIQVEKGATVYTTTAHVTDLERADVETLFGAGGLCLFVSDETPFHAVTALSGSGPAYIFLLIEALRDAARAIKLDDALILPLIYQTIEGAVALAKTSPLDPGTLRAHVTSKGGTTEAALAVFETRHFKALIEDALKAAVLRSETLAAQTA